MEFFIEKYFQTLIEMGEFVFENPILSIVVSFSLIMLFRFLNPFSRSRYENLENEIKSLQDSKAVLHEELLHCKDEKMDLMSRLFDMVYSNNSLKRELEKSKEKPIVVVIDKEKEE